MKKYRDTDSVLYSHELKRVLDKREKIWQYIVSNGEIIAKIECEFKNDQMIECRHLVEVLPWKSTLLRMVLLRVKRKTRYHYNVVFFHPLENDTSSTSIFRWAGRAPLVCVMRLGRFNGGQYVEATPGDVFLNKDSSAAFPSPKHITKYFDHSNGTWFSWPPIQKNANYTRIMNNKINEWTLNLARQDVLKQTLWQYTSLSRPLIQIIQQYLFSSKLSWWMVTSLDDHCGFDYSPPLLPSSCYHSILVELNFSTLV